MVDEYAVDIYGAVEALNRGKIIVYPTDTVWGIGCDATDAEAVAKVYGLKRRNDSKALIVLVADMDSLMALTMADPAMLLHVVEEFSDRPTTFVIPATDSLAPNLLADDGTVGVRITNEKFSNALCREFGKPLVSTSANISGEPTAATYQDISAELLRGADYVCASRRQETNRVSPSRVVKINSDGSTFVIRQ
ncbi:MAG: L-threonylcarbamoyladenylate synthase [Muribaculum sp.]|nr:L-threonylcarbamoyladenylate synthase [Muribaculaceae bacterium]MCM1080719.1 L-threonylcarbamoyladenylate synthase [Muribaculum sp.]